VFTWIARFIEKHPDFHRASLRLWRLFPPRLAGFLKGVLARNWVIGAVAVMIDEDTHPAEVLIVEHSYRRKGSWGLPGGALESISGDPRVPRNDASPDDAIESALRQEVWEELGIGVEAVRLIRIDAVPYIVEEPGPYRLDFYFRCAPASGFKSLREGLKSGEIKPGSPEIRQIRLVALTDIANYDIFSSDARFLHDDLPRLEPTIRSGLRQTQATIGSSTPTRLT